MSVKDGFTQVVTSQLALALGNLSDLNLVAKNLLPDKGLQIPTVAVFKEGMGVGGSSPALNCA